MAKISGECQDLGKARGGVARMNGTTKKERSELGKKAAAVALVKRHQGSHPRLRRSPSADRLIRRYLASLGG